METTVKAVSAVIGGSISWMVGGFGLAFVVLLGLMAIDFITGLMAGSMVEGLKSSVGKKGLIKKTYIILLIGAVYMIQSLIPALSSAGYAADGIAIAYCVIEFLSIIENGGKLGVPIGPLKNIIAILKQEEGNK